MISILAKNILNGVIGKIYDYRSSWQADEELVVLAAQERYTYTPPKNMVRLSSDFQKSFEEVMASNSVLPVRHLYKITNAHISWHGTVFKNFKIFIPSLFYPGVAKQYINSFLLKQWLGEQLVASKDETIIVVHNQFSAINYFHWMIESLPKLLVIKKYFPNSTVALGAPVPEYIAVTTTLLGFNKSILISAGQVLKATQVILAEATLLDGHQDPILMRQLRDELLSALTIKLTQPYRKIYVSRARQHMRRLINEDAIGAMFAQYGFEKVFFEDMTFAEQVRLVSETSILAGVHGANLTNTLFLHPSTKVIELINEQAPNLVYYRMASYLNLEYFSVPCKAVEGADSSNNADLIADPVLLQEVIKKALQSN